MSDVIHELANVLDKRKSADPETSYVACLYEQGTAKILAKIEEEAGELVEAAREGNNEHIIHEAADLWFHTLVLLCALGIRPDEVLSELGRRFGTSGHEEKAGRENNRPTSG